MSEIIEEKYKKSKLGLIPSDWGLKTLKELTTKIGDGLHTTPVYSDNTKFYFINGNNLINNKIVINDKTKCVDENEFLKHKKLLNSSTILLSINGTIGNIAFFNNEKVVLGKSAAYLNVQSNFSKDYLAYQLQTYNINNLFKRVSTGTTIKNLGLKEIQKIKIPVPPLKEQQKIAQILSQWDEAIETIQTLINQLQLRKKGLMQSLLSGKKRLAGFSDKWEEFQFGNLLKDVKRPVDWNDEELYDLISVRRRSGGLFFRESLYGHQILTKKLKTAKSGDFLISKMQIVHGASGLVTKEFDGAKISGSYLSLRAIDETKTDINFINWLSKTSYFYYQTLISSYGVHIEKMTFNFKLFQKSRIKMPSLEEQKRIVEILEAAQSEILHQEDKLKQLRVSKKGLMQQLLTGKKRVKL